MRSVKPCLHMPIKFFMRRSMSLCQSFDRLYLGQRIHSADPRNILSRGYVLVADDSGVVVKTASGRKVGDSLRLLFEDGSMKVVIEQIEN